MEGGSYPAFAQHFLWMYVMPYDYAKCQLLAKRRKKAKVTQIQAAEYFGLGLTGRNTVSAWEAGSSAPDLKRRPVFVSYLWEKLGLKDRPEDMGLIWQEVMDGQWDWDPLTQEEYPAYRPKRVVQETKEEYLFTPQEIPSPTADFVGRADDIAELASVIERIEQTHEASVICGIYGLGGVGKTELAYKVAHRVKHLFPHGQLLLELGGEARAQVLHEPSFSVTAALIKVIKTFYPDATLSSDEHQLAEQYRSVLSSRQVLILADNARDTAQVQPLIPPPGCALLITSRRLIHLNGIKMTLLGGLSPIAAEALLVDICPRIAIHASELARLCAFLPLALRISASHLALTPGPVASFLEKLRTNPLSHLVSQEPQLSVEASLQISFDALDPDVQQVIVQLSVFPASFDTDAARAVVQGGPDMEEVLGKLYQWSMVEWQDTTDRYALHDLVRDFCAKRLPDTQAVQLRHAQYYATVAARAEQTYSKNNLDGMELFDRERVHIDAGWRWALTQAHTPDIDRLLIAYGVGTRRVGDLRYDKRSERIPLLEAMRNAAQSLEQRDAEGRALHYLGNAYYLLGDMAAAGSCYEQSFAIAQEIGATSEVEDLFNELGLVYRRTGNSQRATSLFRERLAMARHNDNTHAEAVALCNLGLVHLERRQPRRALTLLNASLQLCQNKGYKKQESAAMTYLGEAYGALGDEQKAIVYLRQSLAIDSSLGDEEGEAAARWRLGRVLARNNPKEGLTFMELTFAYACKNNPSVAEELRPIIEELRQRVAKEQQE